MSSSVQFCTLNLLHVGHVIFSAASLPLEGVHLKNVKTTFVTTFGRRLVIW